MSSVATEATRLYRAHKETADAIREAALVDFYSTGLRSLNNVTLDALIGRIQQVNASARKHFEANGEQYVSDALQEAEAAGVAIEVH